MPVPSRLIQYSLLAGDNSCFTIRVLPLPQVEIVIRGLPAVGVPFQGKLVVADDPEGIVVDAEVGHVRAGGVKVARADRELMAHICIADAHTRADVDGADFAVGHHLLGLPRQPASVGVFPELVHDRPHLLRVGGGGDYGGSEVRPGTRRRGRRGAGAARTPYSEDYEAQGEYSFHACSLRERWRETQNGCAYTFGLMDTVPHSGQRPGVARRS
jgi:hypothetical protein